MAEDDWLFDYVLQFLESDKFDSVVMDFIDEKCEFFDNEEENKFIYSEIHQEFREMVEAMISSTLGELGVTIEMFFQACEKGRFSRDINQVVIERIVAMDDFITFKKIMVKRNMELQLEALKACSQPRKSKSVEREEIKLSEKETEELDRIIQDSLMEMEMLHIQAEMEAMEMERVLAMSLALEEEKLYLMQTELEEIERRDASNSLTFEAESKDADMPSSTIRSLLVEETKTESKVLEEAKESKAVDEAPLQASPSKVAKQRPVASSEPQLVNVPEVRPLKLKMDAKPLPSIGSTPAADVAQLQTLSDDLVSKRKAVEEQFRRNKESQKLHKENVDLLVERVAEKSSVDKTEVEAELRRRAEHMKEQRERIVAMKRKEREEKVAMEERLRKQQMDSEEAQQEADKLDRLRMKAAREEKGLSEDELLEKKRLEENKRGAMRMALAQRMKVDLLSTAMTDPVKTRKAAMEQQQQFNSLDAKLKEMDQLVQDHKAKEVALTEEIQKSLSTKTR